ncbi:hypothetical protein SZ55_0233 [Pseudomonas sp. FeS53a]|nr:hypothetical protein SZ55_0233 [Pseudomonas sp. FeS53a]
MAADEPAGRVIPSSAPNPVTQTLGTEWFRHNRKNSEKTDNKNRKLCRSHVFPGFTPSALNATSSSLRPSPVKRVYSERLRPDAPHCKDAPAATTKPSRNLSSWRISPHIPATSRIPRKQP